jgi:hypothetical protein
MQSGQSQELIEVQISHQGEILVNPIGFIGKECDKAAEPVYEALGVVSSREDKPEYFDLPNNSQASSVVSRIRQ